MLRIIYTSSSVITKLFRPFIIFILLSLDSIGDFIWRPNSDNLVSVSRDERLVHTNISSAIKTDKFVSLFSLNTTSKGHVYTAMPNIDNEYIHSLYSERHIPVTYTNLQKFYSEEMMSTFLKWNETIKGKSIVGVYSNSLSDNSVELFHQFARRWTFGNGEKSSEALAHICDRNSFIAEQLKRPDLKATWQVLKMIYTGYDNLLSYRVRSSRTTPSVNKHNYISDSLSGHRHHNHYHHHNHPPVGGKINNIDILQQENEFNEELNGRKRVKSQEQITSANSQMGKNH